MRRPIFAILGFCALTACLGNGATVPSLGVAGVDQEAGDVETSQRNLFARIPQPSGVSTADASKPGDPDYRKVSFGTTLPFGEIARLCDTPARKLGNKIDAAGGFALIDSKAGATMSRSLYLDGFSDGCVRQFTGALAVLSDPSTHESMHYGPAGATLSATSVTGAYERVKSRICRVAKGKPCGRSISRLDKNTTFVTVYQQFGGGTWVTMLVHDGKLVAVEN